MSFSKEKNLVLCVLGFGSNRPHGGLSPEEIINSAALDFKEILAESRLSPLYRTSPIHITDQEDFINAAVSGFFPLIQSESQPLYEGRSALKLLEYTQKIEAKYGRNRNNERRWGERSLDIDILLFGNLVINYKELVIPHPRLKERAFALRPMLDLLPFATEPDTGIHYRDIITGLPEQGIYPL